MNEDLYIAFESYLNNEMPTEERLEFEKKLQADADMLQQFEAYKETTQFLSVKFDSKTEDFKQNLKAISKENFAQAKSKPKVIAFKPWHYAVAASLVIGLGLWFMMPGNPQYSDYNQHENAYFIERNGYMDYTNLQTAFNNKDYKKAVIEFEKIRDLSSPEMQYFYAIALIETDNYAKAESLLNDIKSGTSAYKDKATWYLALSNLKQKKYDECKAYLMQIPEDAEDYEKAQKLLKDLD